MNVRIIANPVAGGGRGVTKAHQLAHALEAKGVTAEVHATDGPGDAERVAALPGADVVVAVGGDGSANEVANGLKDLNTALAILPLGTANSVAAELNIPHSPAALASLIAERRIRTIDIGRLNGRRFLLCAGAGIDAAVVEYLHARRGKKLTFAGYVYPCLRTAWTYDFPPVRVTVDGNVVCEEAHYVVVGNARFTAGVFPVTREAEIDDGFLDVCAFLRLNAFWASFLVIASWGKRFIRRKRIAYHTGKSIRLEPASGARVPLQVDGDPAGELPAEIDIEAESLRVIAP